MEEQEQPGRTAEEELAGLDLVIKALQARAKVLRERLPAEMAKRKVEVVAAYDDAGTTKLARVRYVAGNTTATVTDEDAFVRWCGARYPGELEEIVRVTEGFAKKLLMYSQKVGKPGDKGVDPATGEPLDFIEVQRGAPYVKVESTEEGQGLAEAFVKRVIPELTA